MQVDTGRCSVYCMSALRLAHTLVTFTWSLGSQTLYLDKSWLLTYSYKSFGATVEVCECCAGGEWLAQLLGG